LLLTPGLGGTVLPLHHVIDAIAPSRRCVAFTARGVDDGREPLSCVEAMAAVHVEEAIAAYPEGPYRIAGWSFGGLVAFDDAAPGEDPAGSSEQRRVIAAHTLARSRYRPGPFAGSVALFRAATASLAAEATPALGWDRVATESLEVQRIAGDHRSMLTPPHAAILGAAILAFLARLEG
jgi:thioesterase domain-containing protein